MPRLPPPPAEPGSFRVVAPPQLGDSPAFRFAFQRVKGPYVPWARVRALDDVAEALERAEVPRTGPAFGVYYDLPWSARESEAWVADLGYPVPDGARIPKAARDAGVRTRRLAAARGAMLRYVGDVDSFPPALAELMEWGETHGHELDGTLLERFHVSDALSGVEERDVYVTLQRVPSRLR